MKSPWDWSESDVQELIKNRVQESLTLDYKACKALDRENENTKNELSKDVSAFANSAGGVIVYGMREDKHFPTDIDDGYDPNDISKEWIEQVINSKIQRRIDGIRINQHELTPTDEDWEKLSADLALCLSDLVEDEYLVLTSKREGYYVQFAAQGQFGMRVEAVSNAYLHADAQLSAEDYVKMGQLGWRIPDRLTEKAADADGSPNFFADFSTPVDFEVVSDLAIRTLRCVYRIHHPGNLQYKSFSSTGTQIRFPTLRLKREN